MQTVSSEAIGVLDKIIKTIKWYLMHYIYKNVAFESLCWSI